MRKDDCCCQGRLQHPELHLELLLAALVEHPGSAAELRRGVAAAGGLPAVGDGDLGQPPVIQLPRRPPPSLTLLQHLYQNRAGPSNTNFV